MRLTLITPPAVDPVTLDEVKDHLRITQDFEDALLTDFIRTATQKLDGRYGLLGRCLINQTWRLSLDRFSREIVLPFPPVQAVSRIYYLGHDGEEVDVTATNYRVSGLSGFDGATIRAARGLSWPETYDTESAFIEFTAGFGSAPADVPEPIRTAIKMHVGHLYANRESVTLGSGFITETPHGYEDLIRDYRVLGF